MKKKVLLTEKDIFNVLNKNEGWSINTKQTQLSKIFLFSNYIEALVFIARISVHAEVLNHHPVIEFSYAKVKVKLSTQKVKGLTKLDVALLERIEMLEEKSE